MTRLERRNDALGAGHEIQRFECLSVSHRDVPGQAFFFELGVLRAHTGVIQSCTDRMSLEDLPLGILQKVGPGAVEYAR